MSKSSTRHFDMDPEENEVLGEKKKQKKNIRGNWFEQRGADKNMTIYTYHTGN